jgi:hypothetical protein
MLMHDCHYLMMWLGCAVWCVRRIQRADRFSVTIYVYSHLHVTFAHQTILFAVCTVAGDNNKQGIVASSFARRTSAIFNGGACRRINSTARILALNMQDLGFWIQCLQFHHVQWTKQLTTVGQAIQGTFPENNFRCNTLT